MYVIIMSLHIRRRRIYAVTVVDGSSKREISLRYVQSVMSNVSIDMQLIYDVNKCRQERLTPGTRRGAAQRCEASTAGRPERFICFNS